MLIVLKGESVFELCSVDLLPKMARMLNLVCIPSGSGNELLKENLNHSLKSLICLPSPYQENHVHLRYYFLLHAH